MFSEFRSSCFASKCLRGWLIQELSGDKWKLYALRADAVAHKYDLCRLCRVTLHGQVCHASQKPKPTIKACCHYQFVITTLIISLFLIINCTFCSCIFRLLTHYLNIIDPLCCNPGISNARILWSWLYYLVILRWHVDGFTAVRPDGVGSRGSTRGGQRCSSNLILEQLKDCITSRPTWMGALSNPIWRWQSCNFSSTRYWDI